MRRYLKYEKRVVNNEKAKRVATNSFKQLEVAPLQCMTSFPAHHHSKSPRQKNTLTCRKVLKGAFTLASAVHCS